MPEAFKKLTYCQVNKRIYLFFVSILIFLFCLISFETLADEVKANQTIAPVIYVERCGFSFTGENCGDHVKPTIFLNSDEFISFTDNWAVGREGNYKVYLSCIGPDDKQYIDGKLSLATVVVSGQDLAEAHEIAGRFLEDFITEISGHGDQRIKCTE